MSHLWMTIEPGVCETRLMLTVPLTGTTMRARLPVLPRQPRALGMLLESLVAWYGLPLGAVLDADAQDVRRHPEKWAQLVGELDQEQIRIEWVGHWESAPARRDRFLGKLGDFRRAKRLLTFAATGLK